MGNLAVKFENSSDPVLFLDRSGKIICHNEALGLLNSSLLQGQCSHIKDILDESAAASVLTNQGILFQEADLSRHLGKALIFSLLSFRIGIGDPAKDQIFVILKACDMNPDSGRSHENSLNSVAHDLKNPLGAIFGYADALIDTEIGKGLTEKQREILSRIRSTSVRSIELVRNMQHLSSLKGSLKGESEKASDLNQIAMAVYKGTWRENQHEPLVELKLSSDPLPVFLERILIDRIVTNLYSNALKYTPTDGKIEIKTTAEKDSYVFEIKNTKAFIAPEEIDKIFESRYRAKSSNGIAGTGLGLYIVKEILKKVSGKISVKSSQNEGTVFTVYFPKVN